LIKTINVIQNFPVEYELTNGTKVFVKKIDAQSYEFHLTRLNGMRHNFIWTNAQGISNSESATGLGSGSFAQEELEAVNIFQQMLA
jgi:hypothetical protein